MSRTIHPVILSGGSGTRLWPLSRDLFPKQLLSLVTEESLLAATAQRVTGDRFAAPIIVCNKDHRVLVQEQLADVGIAARAIIIEPTARNTAPAIAAAAAVLRDSDPDGLMLILPSDHIIRDLPAFAHAITVAADAAVAGNLVTFGLTPTAPETGYGYISSGAPLEGVAGAFRVARFVEKPDLATATRYLDEGVWSWNSGMFVFPVGLLLEELGRFEPEIVDGAIRSVAEAVWDGEVVALDASAFGGVPSKSIDYALMEPTALSAVVPASLDWSDIGSWSALWEIGDKDATANVTIGDVMTVDTAGSYIRSHGPLIATLGIDNVIMVATGDVVLVAAKHRAQDVKTFVNRLKADGRSEATAHVVRNEAWGVWEALSTAENYSVRKLVVKPGRTIPSGAYGADAIHWVVLSGVAAIEADGESLVLQAGASLDTAAGSVVSVANNGTAPLQLIAAQLRA
jgi:mannose-1-phosphate guanylyltransferase/mannose-1-phosphate guanylyltransferase/mannose-6-phosphate isomerase